MLITSYINAEFQLVPFVCLLFIELIIHYTKTQLWFYCDNRCVLFVQLPGSVTRWWSDWSRHWAFWQSEGQNLSVWRPATCKPPPATADQKPLWEPCWGSGPGIAQTVGTPPAHTSDLHKPEGRIQRQNLKFITGRQGRDLWDCWLWEVKG